MILNQLIKKAVAYIAALLIISSVAETSAQKYNLPPGKYPGSPDENFAPSMVTDNAYRNIASNKPAYGSGSYDFYLTPQLMNDGVIETKMPGWIVTSTSDEVSLPRNEREYFLDRHPATRKSFEGTSCWVQIQQAGEADIPQVNGFKISGSASTDSDVKEIKPWKIIISASNDLKDWKTIKTISGSTLFGDTLKDHRRAYYPKNYRTFDELYNLDQAVNYKVYRVKFYSPNMESWRIAEFVPAWNGKRCPVGGAYNFSSSWKSAGSGSEWVYIDLGTVCSFDKIKLFWLKKPASGRLQVSDDLKSWRDLSELKKSESLNEEYTYPGKIQGRYVKLQLDEALSPDDGYVLSEMEVYGTGALTAAAHPQAEPGKNGEVILSGGNWKLIRSSFVNDNMEQISGAGYNDKNWITATVPGTVFISYLNNGMVPDPNYSDNQLLISDSYFYSDFIYRDEFNIPVSYSGKKVFLNVDGINWKADIFVNGTKAGRVEGAFTTGKLDVTNLIQAGKSNAVAVYIYKNDNPGFVKEPTFESHDVNGGELGADNPTFHTSVGWDWFPSARGRNIGIWNEMYLSVSGDVTIENPFVNAKLPLPDTSKADLRVKVNLVNHSDKNIKGVLKGSIGEKSFEYPVELDANENKPVTLDKSALPVLHITNPRLWWPNGYGEQNLYDVKLQFVVNSSVSDEKEFKTGIREMTYSEAGNALRMWVNGKRFIPRGGNWGFSESNLRYRSREYDIAVRYQKEMNFNMLRNWVGQTGDNEFFEACDKYGILIFQDFWLANPGDGPNPNDHKLFMQNTDDFIKRIRNHPSIGLYCGRNEGFPPEELDKYFRKVIPELNPGVHYISSSADLVVSGHGPYASRPLKYYFSERATKLFHSEIGLPAPVSYASMKLMMPDSCIWPVNRMWGVHDFSMNSAQEGKGFIATIEENFGKIDSAKEWLKYAQLLSYQGYRGILEAQSKNRMGVLFWMTHCAWQSMVFQTYDYFFEPTGSYFGSKKGSEPLHIQWNAYTDSIEVVNYSVPDGSSLSAVVELINMDGSMKHSKKYSVDCSADQTKYICKLEHPDGLSDVYFIRLRLEKGNSLISENFYWNGTQEENYTALRKLPKIKLDIKTNAEKKNSKWLITSEIVNNTKTPAFMARLNTVGSKTGARILPAIYSDNFVTLLPGEKKIITIEVNDSDTNGETPVVYAEGINIE